MISGKTTLIAHLGYPTFAFKAPLIYNPWFDKNDIDAVVVPMGVKPEEYREFFPLLFKMTNIRGALVTMPHKVTTTELVDELTPIAQVAGASNAVLLREDGSLLGDQFDGAGFARGVAAQGLRRRPASAPWWSATAASDRRSRRRWSPPGSAAHRPVRPVHRGVRGAGRPADQALPGRRGRRRVQGPGRLRPGGQRDPAGMKDDDPLPMDIDRIAPTTFVADVVMKQTITPFLQAAIDKGCQIQVGNDMLFEQIPGVPGVLRLRLDHPGGAAGRLADSGMSERINQHGCRRPAPGGVTMSPAGAGSWPWAFRPGPGGRAGAAARRRHDFGAVAWMLVIIGGLALAVNAVMRDRMM